VFIPGQPTFFRRRKGPLFRRGKKTKKARRWGKSQAGRKETGWQDHLVLINPTVTFLPDRPTGRKADGYTRNGRKERWNAAGRTQTRETSA